jgi:ferrous iron transport protein B
MSCSARLPVYVLLTSLLFADRPLLAGLAFAGCYLLGAGAALATAFVARRTVLRGRSRPMVLELPSTSCRRCARRWSSPGTRGRPSCARRGR